MAQAVRVAQHAGKQEFREYVRDLTADPYAKSKPMSKERLSALQQLLKGRRRHD